MKASEQTYQQIERALRKAASKFVNDTDNLPLTDLYIQVKQEGGELRIYNDDDEELTRCVVEEWIDNHDEDFYTQVQPILSKAIAQAREVTEHVAILKPYSYVLIGEKHETLAELYLVDDETLIVSEELMAGLDEDLDAFWKQLVEKTGDTDRHD